MTTGYQLTVGEAESLARVDRTDQTLIGVDLRSHKERRKHYCHVEKDLRNGNRRRRDWNMDDWFGPQSRIVWV